MSPWITSRRLRAVLPFASVCVVGAAAYANTFSVPMVFDDWRTIVWGDSIHALELTPSALAPAVQSFPVGRWLAMASFAVNHALGGLDPTGYHAVNLLFHLAAAIVVLLLAREVFERAGGLAESAQRRAATVSALVFVAHPVQTQAVTYVVQRMASMGAFFGLLALLLFVRARATSGRARFLTAALALGSAFLAFSCKENFAVLPVLALSLEILLFHGFASRVRAHPRVLVAGVLVAVALAAVLYRAHAGLIASEAERYTVGVGERLLTQPRVLWLYLSLLAFPAPFRLHVDYYWSPSSSLFDPATTLPAILGVVALATAAWLLRRRVPLFSFAVAWFLAALAMEQTILPVDFVFEHRLYMAAVGWFLLFAWALERLVAVRPNLRVWAIAAPLVGLLVAATFARNETWNDPIALFADPVGNGPGQIRNLVTLGFELRKRGRYRDAEEALRRAMALDPRNAAPLVTLGALMSDRGRTAEAIDAYERALAMDSTIGQAWYGLSRVLHASNRIDEAERAARRGLMFAPRLAILHVALAECLESRGDVDGARSELEQAVRSDPTLRRGWAALAMLLLRQRNPAEALVAARRLVALAPENDAAHVMAGKAFAALGRPADARTAFLRALQVAPGNVEASAALREIDSRVGQAAGALVPRSTR